MFPKKSTKGFTLLEILLVVGIISILAGIVIVAINPGRQFAQVRNLQRKSDIKQINTAIAQFYIDKSYYPASTTNYISNLLEICNTGASSSPAAGFPCTGLVNLSELVPAYMTAIPVDPQGPVTAFLDKITTTAYAASGGTGYWLGRTSGNKIMLVSERAEIGLPVNIGTTTTIVNGVAGGTTIPGAPTIGTATAGNATSTVTFTTPTPNGFTAITGYTVTSSPAGGIDTQAGTTGLSHLIIGLANGTAYTFTVTATNAIGTSDPSAASNSVTPNGINRYWVGGSGNWDNTTTHWSTTSGGAGGASVPTATDDVYFNNSSSAGNAAYTVTIVTQTANCANLTMLGPSPTNATQVTWAGSQTLNIYGNLNLSGGTAGITRTSTGNIYFESTTLGKTVNTNGVTLASNVYFYGVGGGWTLLSDLNIGAGYLYVTNGSFNSGNKNITASSFNSSTDNVRSIILGSSVLNIGNSGVNMGNTVQSNLTFDAGTSNIIITTAAPSSALNTGGKSLYDITIIRTVTTTAFDFRAFTGAHNFTWNDNQATIEVLSLDRNITITGTLSLSGSSALYRMQLAPYSGVASANLPIVITAANVVFDKVDFLAIQGAGAANWNLSAQAGSYFGNVGGNVGITGFTAAVDQHWTNGGADNRWETAANWTSRVPLPQDSVYMNYAFGTSRTILASTPSMILGNNIDWSGATFTTALTWFLAGNGTIYYRGNVVMKTGMTYLVAGGAGFYGGDNCSITSNGVVFNANNVVRLVNATLTLVGDWTTTSMIIGNAWGTTLDTNGYNLYTPNMNVGGANVRLKTGTGRMDISGYFSFFTGSATMVQTGTIRFTNTSSSDLNPVGLANGIYDTIWFDRGTSTGSIIIGGAANTIATIKDTGTVAHAIKFVDGSTTTITNWQVSGTAGNLITLTSNGGTEAYNLVKAGGGTVSADYLNIQHAIATPVSTWYAGLNSVNNQGVATAGSGWTFTAAP